MEYINPLTGVIAILAISIIDGVVKGIKGRREKLKNPPPKKPVQPAKTDDELTEDEIFAIIYNSFYAG